MVANGRPPAPSGRSPASDRSAPIEMSVAKSSVKHTEGRCSSPMTVNVTSPVGGKLTVTGLVDEACT